MDEINEWIFWNLKENKMHFFERPKSSRETNEAFNAFRHLNLPLVHGFHYDL